MGMKSRMEKYMQEKNISKSDIPKVLITFKLAAYATWISAVPICGVFRPLRRIFSFRYPQKLQASLIRRFPTQYQRYQHHVLSAAEKFGQWPGIRRIPATFGQKPRDFGLAVAEASVLYKIFFPLWAPIEFLFILQWFQKRRDSLDIIADFTEAQTTTARINIPLLQPVEDSVESDDENDENGRGFASSSNSSSSSSGSGTIEIESSGDLERLTVFFSLPFGMDCRSSFTLCSMGQSSHVLVKCSEIRRNRSLRRSPSSSSLRLKLDMAMKVGLMVV